MVENGIDLFAVFAKGEQQKLAGDHGAAGQSQVGGQGPGAPQCGHLDKTKANSLDTGDGTLTAFSQELKERGVGGAHMETEFARFADRLDDSHCRSD